MYLKVTLFWTEKILNYGLEMINVLNDLSKVIKYKIDIQKSIIFLYISNEYSENEI